MTKADPLFVPVTPVSVEPNPSTTATFGSRSFARSLVAAETSAPPEASTSRLEASTGRPASRAAAKASSSGRTMASPTSVTTFARSLSIRLHTALASKDPAGGSTTFPPPSSIWNAAQWALTCISGGVMSPTIPGVEYAIRQLLG